LKTKYEKFIELVKTASALPDAMPVALLLNVKDLELLQRDKLNNLQTNTLPCIQVPYLKQSQILYASGETTKLEIK